MNKKKKVLIIKEDLIFNNILKKHFEHKDYDVEVTTNGLEGMRKAVQSRPNVIIMDVDLPTASGFLVTKKMKTNEVLKEIPIIMVSTLGQDINKKKSLKFGVKDFISVPAQIDELCDRVESYMVDENQVDWFEFNMSGGSLIKG